MKIKKNDQVKVIAGKDKGKTGKVSQVFTKDRKASVKGVNLLIKHIRPNREGEKGQRVEFPAPIKLSNLMLICPSCSKPSRVAYKMIDKEGDDSGKKKVRVCKKCNEIIQ